MKSRDRYWLTLFVALVLALISPDVAAQELESDGDEAKRGLHHASTLQIRVHPPGLKYRADTAYRIPLRESDNILFDGRYFDTGITAELSPTFIWSGPYIELLPIAVLRLRAAVYFKDYFGTFGHLHVSESADGSREALSRTTEQDLAQRSRGWRVELQARPQILVDRIAAVVETSVHRMTLDVEHPYYEPSFGLIFEPKEVIFDINPTIGYIFGSSPSERYTLLGLRWEHSVARRSDWTQTKFGVAWNVQLPPGLLPGTESVVSGYAAVRRKTPQQSRLSPFLGIQFSAEF